MTTRDEDISLEPRVRAARELTLTALSLLATVVLCVLAGRELVSAILHSVRVGRTLPAAGLVVLLGITSFLVYGSFVYQLSRFGWLVRVARHRPATRDALDGLHLAGAPPVTVLVPSYKEDERVVLQTLLCAALQDYPSKRVVLLIDDPPAPRGAEDRASLDAARALPRRVQALLEEPARRFGTACAEFEARAEDGRLRAWAEAALLARLHREAATWFGRQTRTMDERAHAERFFVRLVLERLRQDHLARARRFEAAAVAGGGEVDEALLRREFRRLAALFTAEVVSFERKRYANLSNEPNKAMNLNSYLGLMGQALREVVVGGERLLVPAACEEEADLVVPRTRYVVTLDADSLIAPDYAARLVEVMERPGNERMAVAQTPYSAYPGAPGALERVAGATTDIQRIIHQGFTAFDATYWVGANAVLRRDALDDIALREEERGFTVTRYIQDRTVIEDTESTVDLVARGWTLHNYPDRLAYSATPPDFGSLLIQRRRWANGGLIIVPKLLGYLARRRRPLEAMMRFHYLSSIGVVNAGLLLVLAVPFTSGVDAVWLPFTAVPYFLMYMRDLTLLGYRATDLLRVYALNLLLIPVNLAGVAKSLQQAWTKEKIPFCRTPKVEGRTSAGAFYVAAEYLLVLHWVAAAGFDFLAQRWTHGAFALVNSAFLGYAIAAFVGFRESLADMIPALRRAPAPAHAAPALATPTPDELPVALTLAGGARVAPNRTPLPI